MPDIETIELSKDDPVREPGQKLITKELWDKWAERFGFEDYEHVKEEGAHLEVNWTRREVALVEKG